MKKKLSCKFLTITYIILSLFLFAFVNSNNSTDFKNYTVFFIEGKVVIIHFIFSTIYLVLFLIMLFIENKEIKIDTITICLFLKVILDIISISINYSNFLDYVSWIAISATALITYFSCINAQFSIKEVSAFTKIFIIFGLVVASQVLYTFLKCPVDYLSIEYKSYINVPYGGTNIISSLFVPIIILCFYNLKKPFSKWFFIILFYFAILLTKSRGGMILGALLILFLTFKTSSNTLFRFFLASFVIFAFILLLTNRSFLQLFIGYASSSSLDANSLSTGRIQIWGQMLENINTEQFLIGTGMKPVSVDNTGAHNLLIDMLVRLGFFGFINYFIALFIPILKGVKSNSSSSKTFFFMGAVILINSMFEVCYFYYSLDCVFWIFIGIFMSNHYANKKKPVVYFVRKSACNSANC